LANFSVLYQKIFIREVILTLKQLLLYSFLILFTLLTLFADDDSNTNTPSNLSTEEDTIQTQESFLSSVEYGRMLYKRPRGISCAKCHGNAGRGGQKIAKYYDKNRNPKILKGVNITQYTLDELRASLENQYREKNRRKRHKIMPIYYLTEEEIQAIYNYLQESNKEE
jgi:mono/diheme cytochrome c family protein